MVIVYLKHFSEASRKKERKWWKISIAFSRKINLKTTNKQHLSHKKKQKQTKTKQKTNPKQTKNYLILLMLAGRDDWNPTEVY